MRALTLVTVGALVAAMPAASVAPLAAQEPAPRAPRAPRAPATPRTPAAPRTPEILAFGFADARADRATLGVLLGEAGPDGIAVADVADDGPAARAGIRAGDRLAAVGDASLRLDARDAADPLLRMVPERRLRLALDDLDAGDEVALRVARGGDVRTVRVRTVRADAIAEVPAPTRFAPTVPPTVPPMPPRAPRAPRAPDAPLPPDAPRAGTLFRTLPSPRPDRASVGLTLGSTGSARDTLGVFVAGVVPGGPAERAGIHEGMRIAAIDDVDLRADRRDVGDGRMGPDRAARLERALAELEPGDEVTLRVWDGDRARTVRVRSAPASEVYRDEAAWAPRGAVFGMPGAEALRRLEALEGARGAMRGRAAPEVRIRVDGLRELEPAERERVERRLEAVRERLDEARVRIEREGETRDRLLESRAATRDRLLDARAAEVRARAQALRAAPVTIVRPRRWMD